MPRRKGYYGSPPPKAPTGEPPVPKVERVTGARAIGELLDGMPEKQVYRLIEACREGPDPIPVRKVPTIGLCADKATLLRWWARQLGASAA